MGTIARWYTASSRQSHFYAFQCNIKCSIGQKQSITIYRISEWQSCIAERVSTIVLTVAYIHFYLKLYIQNTWTIPVLSQSCENERLCGGLVRPSTQRLTKWASYQIRKIAGCACAGNAGNVFPRRRFQRKPLVSDPGMHHGTCVTHVPWCMSGSRTRGGGKNVPGIPGACAPAISRIWQEAHGLVTQTYSFP